jgi:hypothetical protein
MKKMGLKIKFLGDAFVSERKTYRLMFFYPLKGAKHEIFDGGFFT